jgi:PAS domain S-box-containing protein
VRPRQVIPVVLVVALTVAGFFVARLLGERDARRDSVHRAEVAAAQIRGRVEQGTSLAEGLRRLMVGVPGSGVTGDEFASNASRWLSPAGFPAAAWVEQVPASQRAAYERRTGHPIVTRDQQGRITPVGSRSSYLPTTLVSGIAPMSVPGIDLGGEPGMAAALTRAGRLYDAGATPQATLPDGTKGLFLIKVAPRITSGVVEPGFVVVFVPELWLRAAATDTSALQLTVGGASTADHEGAASVRVAFTEGGQRFEVGVQLGSVQGAATVLPWIILAAGLVFAVLAGALGVNAARRARAQRELDRIFTLSADLITVADFDGHFTRVNPAVEQVLGYTREEVLARPYLDLVHPDDRDRTAAEAAALSQGKTTTSFENRYVRKDGSPRVLEWTSTPVVEERLMYAVARDVTERRQAEAELERLAGEQTALRRVATLVAGGASPEEVFAAVTEEAGRLLPVDHASLVRYEPDSAITTVAAWSRTGNPFPPVGSQWTLHGKNIGTLVFLTGRPARIDSYADASGALGVASRDAGIGSSVGTPILIEGRLWGTMNAGSRLERPLPPDAEARLAGFTELLATAIANAESRAALARLAEEQAALRRVATLVARAAAPEEVFAAVTEEVGRLLSAGHVGLGRYESDDTMTTVATWGSTGKRCRAGSRHPLGGHNLGTLMFETGRPARIDSYADSSSGPLAAAIRETGLRSAVGAPVIVEGRLWGLLTAGSILDRPLPADTEARLASFTELLATAVANAASRAALAASRARIVAAADETRRRIERDLHDGTQQQLVSLILNLRAARAAVPPQTGELQDDLSHIAEGMAGVLEELREISRGIHPAILSQGGLGHALKTLARRSAVPVELDLRAERRAPGPVEVAVYYAVAEALTNAVKHARASVVHVELDTHDEILRLAIHDDGIGGADSAQGSGLAGLSDRIEALGGTLKVASPADRGTTLLIEIPVEGRSSTGVPEP